jgi:hypothetical protein
MPNQDQIARKLADHERRLLKLESFIGPKTPLRKARGAIPPTTLPQHITRLRDAGFFAQPRTGDEVHEKLKATYACEVDRVAVALLRLAARKELRKATKTVNSRRYLAYVW